LSHTNIISLGDKAAVALRRHLMYFSERLMLLVGLSFDEEAAEEIKTAHFRLIFNIFTADRYFPGLCLTYKFLYFLKIPKV